MGDASRHRTGKSKLLTVYGVWQSESGVKHLIAKWLVNHSHLLGNLAVENRNFTKSQTLAKKKQLPNVSPRKLW